MSCFRELFPKGTPKPDLLITQPQIRRPVRDERFTIRPGTKQVSERNKVDLFGRNQL